jgi:hypothetical protein
MAWLMQQQDNESRRRPVAALVAASHIGLGACGSPAPGASQPPGPSSPAATVTLPSSPTVNPSGQSPAQTVVLDHYRSFFRALPRASRLDEEPQIALLRQYLTGPALAEVAGTLAAQRAHGKVLYGEPVLRPDPVVLRGAVATIRDCQDSSRAGVQDAKTGHKDTVGVPRTLLVTTLKHVDGTWKIASIDFRGPKC